MSKYISAHTEIIAIDNANIIDFLSSIASTLMEEKYISERDVEAFRLTIASLNFPESSSTDFILDALFKEGDRISLSLMEILGQSGLLTSLLSNSLCANCDLIIKTLGALGDELIKTAKLSFNRKLTIERDSGLTDITPASQYFETMAVKVCKTMQEIESRAAQKLYASPLTSKTEAVRIKVAKSLDATSIVENEDPISDFLQNVSTILLTLKHMVANLTKLACALTKSDINSKDKINLNCHIVTSKLDEIQGIYIDFLSKISSSNLQRNAATVRFAEVNESLRVFSDNLVAHFRQINEENFLNGLYDKHKRLIRLELLSKDVPMLSCESAVNKLDSYLSKNEISLDKIIPQELKKIDPNLEFLDLPKFKEECLELSRGGTQRKSMILNSLTELSRHFSKHAHRFVLVAGAIILPGTFGCGVKGNPKTIVEPVRPEVPFQINERQSKDDLERPSKTDISSED